MTAADAEELRTALVNAALKEEASAGTSDEYGTRYKIDFEVKHRERRARIRSCWIVRTGEIAPRFVTCFIL